MTTPTKAPAIQRLPVLESLPICADFDDECEHVQCKTTCWMYQPERGMCMYLVSDAIGHARTTHKDEG